MASQKAIISFLLIPLFIEHSLSFQFTFPFPGKVDYKFASGDVAVVEWAPNETITQLALNCGPKLEIDGDTPAYTLVNANLTSGVHYQIPETWADSYHKYCMFCTGNFNKCCSGIFFLEKHAKDHPLMIHDIKGSVPQAAAEHTSEVQTPPPTTAAPENISSTAQETGTTAAPVASEPVEEIKNTPTEITANSSTILNTESASSQTPPPSTVTPAEGLPSLTTESTTLSTSSTFLPSCLASASTPQSSCILGNGTETQTPSFNFPSVTPSATAALDSAAPSARMLESTLAGVVAIAAFLVLFF